MNHVDPDGLFMGYVQQYLSRQYDRLGSWAAGRGYDALSLVASFASQMQTRTAGFDPIYSIARRQEQSGALLYQNIERVEQKGLLKGGVQSLAANTAFQIDQTPVLGGLKQALDRHQPVEERIGGGLRAISEGLLVTAALKGGPSGNPDVPEGYLRVVPQDQVGTSQAFKLRKGETGLSVFEGVSAGEVLAELPGKRVPNTTVTIPRTKLPEGTTVESTPAEGLSEKLSTAHRELTPPPEMSAKTFAQKLKEIVGWEKKQE